MNLAIRDIRHNWLRFVLTGLGLGGLLGIVVTMMGIYEGALADAVRLPRASNPALWVVEPLTKGPFAEPSRLPRDTRELVRRLPGVAEAGAVTFETVQATANGRPVRLYVQGYEPGRPGGPGNLVAGHGITESHYQIVVDASSGLRLGERVLIGPYHDPYTVVGITRGMVNSGGDPAAWVTLLDAQAIQFAVAPPLQRREKALGRSPQQTNDVNAVMVQLEPGASTSGVAAEIDRWKHLSAVTEKQQEDYLTVFVISRMQKQLGMFMGILIVVAAVIIALIIYTLTMDKMRSIATLKLVGAPDRTIVGLVVQEALVLGIGGYALGIVLVAAFRNRFPRRVEMLPRDLAVLLLIVVVVCLLGSALSVRTAVKVDPAKALSG
jgi:putative ABC transport system permease protein